MALHGRSDVSAEEALRRLLEGNERFLRGEARFAGFHRDRIADLTGGQQPFATILGCSDSRVAPEVIFDCSLGELFVVRVAGNVLSNEVAGSMQYAGSHLGTPLIVVLGHEGCGAIQAALASRDEDVQHRSRIQLLVDSLLPALADVDPGLPPAERLSLGVEANVRWAVRQIEESPEGKARKAEGWMRVVGAVYELATGRVRVMA